MAKKRSSTKSTQSTAKTTNKKAPAKQTRAADYENQEKRAPSRSQRSAFAKIAPYVMSVFALVLAVCFVTVQLLGMDDGAGIVGYYIQMFFCGLFGIAAFILPLVLGYVGMKWCFYNVKFKTKGNSDEQKKARRRLVLQAVMSCLSLLMIATIIGVIEDYGSFDLVGFWEDGASLVGGGIFGSSLGYLFVLCFEVAISLIIIIPLLVVFVMLTFGITPNYVLEKIQASHDRKAEEKKKLEEEEEEYDQYYAEEEEKIRKEELKKAAAIAAREAKAQREAQEREEKKRAQETSVDEIMGLNTETGEVFELGNDTDKSADATDIFFENTGADKAAAATPKKAANTSAASQPQEEILDFGGDSAFDNDEYKGIDEIFDAIKTVPYSSNKEPVRKEAAPAKEIKDEPKETPAKPLDLTKMDDDEVQADMANVALDEGDREEEEIEAITPYIFPPVDLLAENKDKGDADHTAELQENAKRLVETLKSFKVGIQSISYSRGPTITRYELKPEVGTRVKAIANLVDDIALSLATSGVRIEAPIPNKPAVGIEVPNRERATVYLRDLVENPKFTESKSTLTSCLGMDVGGNPVYFDIGKMPHLLIAGTTGSGKSVCINTIILSILYKTRPDEVKLILIDPKQVEFTVYENIPHLYCPIISDPKKAAGALASAVNEMERRFELIRSVGVRNIEAYNEITVNDPEKEYLPKMVVIIDELADLMMTARDDVETSICRLAQKARAAGIHVILGTQRPSVDVITGLIKANVPSRIACTVTSQVDSRTIIDTAGAENLIGRGDMLFAPVGSSKPMRVQCAFVSDGEVEQIIDFIKKNNGAARYNSDFIKTMEEEAARCGQSKKGGVSIEDPADAPEGGDTKFRDAVKLAIETGKISTSLMQRRLGVGYGRAAKIIDTMEQMGYVSAPDGNKPRQVLITMDEYMRRVTEGSLGEMED